MNGDARKFVIDYERVAREGSLIAQSNLQLLQNYIQSRKKPSAQWTQQDLNNALSLAILLIKGGDMLLAASTTINTLLENIQRAIESTISVIQSYRGGRRYLSTNLVCPKCLLEGKQRVQLRVYYEGGDYYLRCANNHYDDYYIEVLTEVACDYLRAAIANPQLAKFIPSSELRNRTPEELQSLLVVLSRGLFTYEVAEVGAQLEQLKSAVETIQQYKGKDYSVEQMVPILIPALEAFLQTVHGRGPILEILLGKVGAMLWSGKDKPRGRTMREILRRALRSLLQR